MFNFFFQNYRNGSDIHDFQTVHILFLPFFWEKEISGGST